MVEESPSSPNTPTAGASCGVLTSLGLLVLRVGVGLQLAVLHGWDKLTHFADTADKFPNPIGLGSTPSLALVTGAEFFCAALVVVGLLTRWAAIPMVIAMGIAAFVFHSHDPWSTRELALLYFAGSLALLLCGGGRFSLDALIFRRRRAKP